MNTQSSQTSIISSSYPLLGHSMLRTMLIYVSCQLVDNRLKNPPTTTTTTTTTKVDKAQEKNKNNRGQLISVIGPSSQLPAAVSEGWTYHSFHFISDFVRGFHFDFFSFSLLTFIFVFVLFFCFCSPHAMQKV